MIHDTQPRDLKNNWQQRAGNTKNKTSEKDGWKLGRRESVIVLIMLDTMSSNFACICTVCMANKSPTTTSLATAFWQTPPLLLCFEKSLPSA